MNKENKKMPVYKNERPLFFIALAISLIFFGALVVAGGLVSVVVVLLIWFLTYLFAVSSFVCHIKGTGALVSENQFSDIYERAKFCAEKIGLKKQPDVYVINGNGIMNAIATKFLRKEYVILHSDVLDALEDDPDAINFYIGHEMGHLDRKHLLVEPIICIGTIFPLVGAAYSRAREYTCDMYGALCCDDYHNARKALVVLGVGAKRYKDINAEEYENQAMKESGKFWSAFHELIGPYPWLVKRFYKISPENNEKKLPKRNPFAFVLAAFVFRYPLINLILAFYIVYMIVAGSIFWLAAKANTESMEQNYYEPMSDEELLQYYLEDMADSYNQDTPYRVNEHVVISQMSYSEGNVADVEYIVDMSDVKFIDDYVKVLRQGSLYPWCAADTNYDNVFSNGNVHVNSVFYDRDTGEVLTQYNFTSDLSDCSEIDEQNQE